MPFPLANAEQDILAGWRWILLLIQSAMFIFSVAIILRLAQEKRQPSNIFAWSLLLIFLPPIGVPLYLIFGGRKSVASSLARVKYSGWRIWRQKSPACRRRR